MNFSRLFLSRFNNPEKLVAILVFIVSLLLFIWQVMVFFQQEKVASKISQPVNSKNSREMINHKSPVFTFPLFGQYVPKLTDVEIKQSSLDLEVVGVMFSNSETGSQVLIRAGGGEEHLYSIGDLLPGGATIKQINEKGIVVLYNGSMESLSLPKNELLFDEPAKPLIEE